MLEFEYFDGYDITTFNILETNVNQVTIASTYIGKISVITYELYEDENGLYFEYGPLFVKIYVKDFEEVKQYV